MRGLVELAQVDPFILVKGQEDELEIFLKFVRKTIIKVNRDIKLKNPEFFTFLMVLAHDNIRKAAEEYSLKVESVAPDSLQPKARRVRKKILGYLKDKKDLAYEWRQFLEERQKSVN